jgi:hypothetical protein
MQGNPEAYESVSWTAREGSILAETPLKHSLVDPKAEHRHLTKDPYLS